MPFFLGGIRQSEVWDVGFGNVGDSSWACFQSRPRIESSSPLKHGVMTIDGLLGQFG